MKIIKARPGKRTNDNILDLLSRNPQGLTVSAIAKDLNRPVSMVAICLKTLLASNKVCKSSKNNFYFKIPDRA